MFDGLTMAPPDPILGLNEAFRDDPNTEKINLSVGVYLDDTGNSPVFNAVKKAEAYLLETESTKSYLGIGGSADFGRRARELMLGREHPVIQDQRAQTAQTPGGTGALRVAGNFLKQSLPDARLWVSDPTWANHGNIFRACSLQIETYPYFDPEVHGVRFNEMLETLESRAEPGDIILLHGCCHNPTGVDPTMDQWSRLIELMKSRELLPLVDLAYQGFGIGLEEDVERVREMCVRMDELLVCSSYSKNFGLYNERVGALTVISRNKETAERAFSHVKQTIRSNYSNPPAHGGLVVSHVLGDPNLTLDWKNQLSGIRDRIRDMRTLFSTSMKSRSTNRDFSFMKSETGMFSMTGLNRDQIDELREKHSIYIVGSGRVNVAGMSESNIDRISDAIASCL
jgi:aspartate aminotransferase